MRRSAALLLAMVAAAAGMLALAPGARAGEHRFSLTVDRAVLHGGDRLTATARADLRCDWYLAWRGDLHRGSGTTLVATWTAPTVDRVTRVPVQGVCLHDPGPAPRAAGGSLVARVPASWRKTVVVTVLPRGVSVSPPHHSGAGHLGGTDLPGTGGPASRLLLAGLLSLLAGAALATASARQPDRSPPRHPVLS